MRGRLLLVLAACGGHPPPSQPPPAPTPAPPSIVAAPTPPPAPTPAPPPIEEPKCTGHDCVELARATFKKGDRERALIIANTACTTGEAEACIVAADLYDSAHRGGRWTTPIRITLNSSDLRAKGIAGLDAACGKDVATACLALGSMRIHGRHGLGDPAKGMALVAHACDLGELDACVLLASRETDAKRTIPLLERACTGGHQRACVALGKHIAKRDAKRAAELFAAACAADEAVGCAAQGSADKRAGKLDLASAEFTRACELDPGAACTEAAKLAEAKQPDIARTLYTKACDDDDGAACAGLAALVVAGKGGARDWGAGIALFDKACTAETPNACAAAKRARAHPPDWHCTSVDACKQQCAELIAKSCTHLGEVIGDGDCSASIEAFRVACDAGDGRGCELNGDHMPVGIAEQRYAHACELGDNHACFKAAHLQFPTADDAGKKKLARELERACATQDDACAWFATLVPPFQVDEEARVVKLLRGPCARNDARACRVIAQLTGAASDDPAAVALAKKACTLGDTIGCDLGKVETKPKCTATNAEWETGL